MQVPDVGPDYPADESHGLAQQAGKLDVQAINIKITRNHEFFSFHLLISVPVVPRRLWMCYRCRCVR